METQSLLKDQLAKLHPVIQNAISGGKIELHMQELSKKYRLHLDKWQKLENEVTLTILGLESISTLRARLISEVLLTEEEALSVFVDVNLLIFNPIREEIERQLDHPDAKAKEGTPIEDMTAEILKGEVPPPNTPPASVAPTTTVIEQPTSYRAGALSTERKDVHNDPYREAPL